jgi:hypothetical protein
MKNLYLILCFFLFSGFGLQAQSDWQLFRPGVQYLYNYSDAGYWESPILGVKVGVDTCTEMYRSLRWRGESECNEFSSSFIGYAVCQTENLTRLLVHEGKHVTIRQAAALGEEWLAYAYSNDTIWAKAYLIQEETFLGLTDSVKAIHFYRKHHTGALIYVPANNRPIKISKQYGVISTFWFRDFPLTGEWIANSPLLLSLAGLSNPKTGLQNPGRAEIFNLQAGDEIHIRKRDAGVYYPQGEYMGNYALTHYLKATITAIDTIPGTQKIRYSWSGPQLTTWYVTPPGSIYEVTLVEDTTGVWEHNLANLEYLDFQPGALVELESSWEGVAIVSLRNSGFCDKAAKYLNAPVSNDEFCAHSFPDAGSHGSYITGLAGLYYDAQSIGGTYKRTVLYTRQQGVECGVPFDFDQITSTAETPDAPAITLGPNPTAGPLRLQLPQGLIADLKLYDLHGRLLLSENQAQGSVAWNLGALPAGAYQISASQEGRLVWRQRVLKQ